MSPFGRILPAHDLEWIVQQCLDWPTLRAQALTIASGQVFHAYTDPKVRRIVEEGELDALGLAALLPRW